MRRGAEHQEERRGGGIGVVGAGHGDDAADVFDVIAEFALEGSHPAVGGVRGRRSGRVLPMPPCTTKSLTMRWNAVPSNQPVAVSLRKLRTWLGAQSGSILILMVPSVVFRVTVRAQFVERGVDERLDLLLLDGHFEDADGLFGEAIGGVAAIARSSPPRPCLR